MKIYLIDFENVKSKGLTGIDSLTEYDRVIIFYSENADTINFEMHQKVLISKAEVEYFKVHVGGKNALDFQLSTLLGYLVSKNYYSHIFVISNDKSFDFLHDFWHGKYIAAPDCIVFRTKTIAQAINYAGGKKQIVPDDDDTDTAVFGAADDTSTENSTEDITKDIQTAEEVNDTKSEVAETETAQPAPKNEAAEKPPVMSADLTEKRSPKPAPKKEKAPVQAKRTQPDKAEEFTISAEELNALEASFSAYSIIDVKKNDKKTESKTENIPEKKTADIPVEKPAAVPAAKKEAAAVCEPAKADPPTKEAVSEKPADKPKAKSNGFFAALKEIMKKTDCKAEMINHISQLLINSDTKEEFHNALAKDYKQDATELYKLLRPKYLRLREMYAAEHPGFVTAPTADTAPVKAETTVKAETAVKTEAPAKPASEPKADISVPETEKAAEQTSEKAEAPAAAEEKPAKKKTRSTKAKTAKAARSEEDKKPAKTAKPRTKKKAASDTAAPDVNTQTKSLDLLLDGKCSPEEIELIRQLFREVPSRQQLYIRMIKLFGKKEGCVYYNAIKAEYETLREAIK